MKLSHLLASAGLPSMLGNDPEITDVAREANRVREGTLFCCLHQGERAEAELAEAAANGAAAFLISSDVTMTTERPTVWCSDVRRRFAFLCAASASNPQKDMTLIAITGTNGKTSTAWYLASILKAAGIPSASIGTAGLCCDGIAVPFPPRSTGVSQMTTPDPELLFPMLSDLRRRGIMTVVMEVSSHALALDKVAPLRFHTAVFTNFGSDHLDFHRTREAYLTAKLKLATLAERICYNAEDETWQNAFVSSPNAVPFGKNQSVRLENLIKSDDTSRFSLVCGEDRAQTALSTPATFASKNALAATVAAMSLGIDLNMAAKGIAAAPPIPGRAERVILPAPLANAGIYIDYAHTAKALDALLCDFDSVSGALTVLFGCGGDRDRTKRAEMAQILQKHHAFAVVTSDNPRTESRAQILADVIAGFGNSKNYIVIPDRSEAVNYAVSRLSDGDTLLLCGKGAEEYECDAEGMRPYAERETVVRAAEKRMVNHEL